MSCCGILDDNTVALFSDNGGCCGPTARGQPEEFEVLSYGNFRGKITACTCLLSREDCDSFPRHLDLALTPSKINEGVEKE